MTRPEFEAAVLGGMTLADPPAPVRLEARAGNVFSLENGLIRKQVRVDSERGLRLEFIGFDGRPNLAAEKSRWGSELYTKAGPDFRFDFSGRKVEFLGRQTAAETDPELILTTDPEAMDGGSDLCLNGPAFRRDSSPKRPAVRSSSRAFREGGAGDGVGLDARSGLRLVRPVLYGRRTKLKRVASGYKPGGVFTGIETLG